MKFVKEEKSSTVTLIMWRLLSAGALILERTRTFGAGLALLANFSFKCANESFECCLCNKIREEFCQRKMFYLNESLVRKSACACIVFWWRTNKWLWSFWMLPFETSKICLPTCREKLKAFHWQWKRETDNGCVLQRTFTCHSEQSHYTEKHPSNLHHQRLFANSRDSRTLLLWRRTRRPCKLARWTSGEWCDHRTDTTMKVHIRQVDYCSPRLTKCRQDTHHAHWQKKTIAERLDQCQLYPLQLMTNLFSSTLVCQRSKTRTRLYLIWQRLGSRGSKKILSVERAVMGPQQISFHWGTNCWERKNVACWHWRWCERREEWSVLVNTFHRTIAPILCWFAALFVHRRWSLCAIEWCFQSQQIHLLRQDQWKRYFYL